MSNRKKCFVLCVGAFINGLMWAAITDYLSMGIFEAFIFGIYGSLVYGFGAVMTFLIVRR